MEEIGHRCMVGKIGPRAMVSGEARSPESVEAECVGTIRVGKKEKRDSEEEE